MGIQTAGKTIVLTQPTRSISVRKEYFLNRMLERQRAVTAVVRRFRENAARDQFIGSEAYEAAKTLRGCGVFAQVRKDAGVKMWLAAGISILAIGYGAVACAAANYLSGAVFLAAGMAEAIVAVGKAATRRGIDFVLEVMPQIEKSIAKAGQSGQ